MDDDNQSQAKQTLEILDKAIAAGSWDESSFIVMMGKKLKAIRDDLAAQIVKAEENELTSPEYLAHRAHLNASLQLVYISLYSSEGITLNSWERIIANLQRQIVSRPIYANEEDVQNIIRTKEKKINEAYVALFVDKTDILELHSDKVSMDKLGKPMMVLKDNSINLENMEYFVHLSGKYRYSRGRLIKLE